MGDYVPGAPVNDEARKRNENLPGMGGVFNAVNLHAYHYAGNNPVKYTDPTGRDSVWEIDRYTNTINIELPVNFSAGTTAEQKQAFHDAAKQWEGEYSINGINFSVSMNIVEVSDLDTYRGRRVNTVTFSPLEGDDNSTPPLISHVKDNKDMMLYRDDASWLSLTIKHEIGHLLGLRDRYFESVDSNGDRFTPPVHAWRSNIMASLFPAHVEGRNFEEGFLRNTVNRIIYKNR